MRVLLRLGLRDLARNFRFTLLFIVNLALGLTGFLLISSFGGSLGRHLDANLREILTADLVLQSTRPLTAQEVQRARTIIGEGSVVSEQISFYSMVKGDQVAKLVQIVAIDAAYPLYGAFRYPEGLTYARVVDGLQREPRLLMSRETAQTFGVRPGDALRIGQSGYEAADFFEQDPGSEFSTLALAPKIYLGLSQVRDSGLIRFGSRINYKQFVRLPAGVDPAPVFARLTAAFSGEPGQVSEVRVANTVTVNRRLGQMVDYFRGFLGLAGMVALMLSGMTSAYLFREHLQARLQETAILLSLGASRSQCLALFTGQLSLLGLLAALLAIGLAWSLLPLFGQLFAGIIPAQLHLAIDPVNGLVTVLVGAVGSLLFCLPVYRQIFQIRPLVLLQEPLAAGRGGWKGVLPTLLTLLPALIMLALLASVVSGSARQGVYFTAGLLLLVLLFALIVGLLLTGCQRWSQQTGRVSARIVWRNLARNRLAVTAGFVAMATALLLMHLVPQIENGLREEIGQPEERERPDFFLVDIQEEQREPLRTFFQGSGPLLSPLAPMIQGRIARVNGVELLPWLSRRPGAAQTLFQRTEFNFSSREQLDPSETVIKGLPMSTQPWSGATEMPFEISMEQQFSERLGVTIGDRLVVDVLGIELEGRIVNLRKVRWNSFQPNFFMLVQRGVLDEAPKTFLASVSRVAPAEKQATVHRLVGVFPNISVIDVTRLVEQLGDIGNKLTSSLRFMAWLALATGLVAVISIARQEALRREREINLLRVLGAGIGRIRLLVMLEFGFLGGMAALAATLLSYGCSYAVAWWLFDRIWRFEWQSGLLVVVAAPLLCAVIAGLASDAVIRRKPVALLG